MTLAIEHVADDDLSLYYYGEHPRALDVEAHLAACETCEATFQEIVATLSLVDDVPEPLRDERYGLEVWQRLRPSLPPRRRAWWAWRPAPALGFATAAVLIGGVMFTAGRYWPSAEPAPLTAVIAPPQIPDDAKDRARVAAVVDHLERSERVLVDLSNDASVAELEQQQGAVRDLLDVNRLYREAANQAGDSTVAGVLDDLERALLDIVHAPTTLTANELAVVRARLDAAALLFKVRILSHELRDREEQPVAPRKTT